MLIGSGGVLGIDIGSNSIKVIELDELGTSYVLSNIGEIPVPEGAIIDKTIRDKDAVTGSLSTLLDDLGVQTDNAAVAISGDPVLLKRVSLPRMSDAELKISIKWEMEQLGSSAIEHYNYDYKVLSESNSYDKTDVLIAAVNKSTATEYVSILSNAGLNPVLVELDVFSLENMYQLNYPDSDGLIALVNIGASVTNLLIIQNGETVFARDLLFGGHMYTEKIKAELGLSYEEAEEIKHNQLVGFSDPQIDIIYKDFIQSISCKIKETLDFFNSSYSSDVVTRIMISGGTAALPDFKNTLSEIANSYVGLINPFRKISIDENIFDPEYIKDISPKMSIAAGLALNRT